MDCKERKEHSRDTAFKKVATHLTVAKDPLVRVKGSNGDWDRQQPDYEIAHCQGYDKHVGDGSYSRVPAHLRIWSISLKVLERFSSLQNKL